MASADPEQGPRAKSTTVAPAPAVHVASGSQPSVAVILPCRDASATVASAVDSVLAQDVGDIELIIVDDGSGQACRDRVRTLAERDPRITLIEQAAAGPAVSRNRGVRTSQAPLIAFLDAGDTWRPDHLSHHVAAFETDPRLGVSVSPLIVVDETGEPTGARSATFAFELSINDILGGTASASFSTLVVHRDVFIDSGPFLADMAAVEVQAWLLRVIATRWIVAGIAEHTVLSRRGVDDGAESTRTMLAAWAGFLHQSRGLRASQQPQPSGPASRFARGQPRRGLCPPSKYMTWFPPLLARRAQVQPGQTTS